MVDSQSIVTAINFTEIWTYVFPHTTAGTSTKCFNPVQTLFWRKEHSVTANTRGGFTRISAPL